MGRLTLKTDVAELCGLSLVRYQVWQVAVAVPKATSLYRVNKTPLNIHTSTTSLTDTKTTRYCLLREKTEW